MDGKLIYFFSEFERPSLQIDLERPLSSLLMYALSRGTLKFYIINCLYFIRYRSLILVNNMVFFPCECESVHVFVNTGTRSMNYKQCKHYKHNKNPSNWKTYMNSRHPQSCKNHKNRQEVLFSDVCTFEKDPKVLYDKFFIFHQTPHNQLVNSTAFFSL